MKKAFALSAFTAALLLTGCGGGGGGGTPPSNQSPVANAGSDRTVQINSTTTIAGSGTDSDGTINTYSWSEGGTEIGTSATLSYTPSSTGSHTLTLTVTDDDGATASDSVTLNVISSIVRNQNLLIVRVNFTDKTFSSDEATWSSKIFGTSPGELNHYYNEISYGKFQFVPVTESDGVNDGLIDVTLSVAHPGNDDPASGDFHMWDRLKEALVMADTNIDFSAYDTDSNGKISDDELQVMFLVAGGESSTGMATSGSIWALASCYDGSSTVAAPVLDGVKVMDCASLGGFSRFGEKHFPAPNTQDATIGIIAHELGHAALGLPDLYDADGQSGGIGQFGLMGGGSWGMKPGERPGQTPVHMTGWSKMQSLFVSPTVVSADQTITADGTDSTSYALYQINTSTPGEYFLIENRPPSGYDLGLSRLEGLTGAYTGGLSILHIDDNVADNKNPSHKKVDVMEAAQAQLDLNSQGYTVHNTGHIDNLFRASGTDTLSSTDTNEYGGASTGLQITNISAAGSSMTADVDLP